MNKVFAAIMTIVVCVLLIAVILGGIKTTKQTNSVVNDCVETDMYVIGNKGRRAVVYDCGEEKK